MAQPYTGAGSANFLLDEHFNEIQRLIPQLELPSVVNTRINTLECLMSTTRGLIEALEKYLYYP